MLHHESDLDLAKHYTDTHGYAEINFAAFTMIGKRFRPRIKSLHRQRIYCADPGRDHGVLEPVLERSRRAVDFRLIAEQWERVGQFYAANRELGRVLKTEFVLPYRSEPETAGQGASRPAQGRAAPCVGWPEPSTTASAGASARATSTTR